MRTNIKRITSLLLALVMMLSLAVTAFAADNGDIPEGAVYVTNDNGDIVGYYDAETGGFVDLTDLPAEPANSEFTPEDDLALVTKFSDVKSNAWYYNDVTECAKLGIVAGFEDGTFKPEDKVTDIQLIVMLTRTFYNDKVETAKKNASGKPWYWPNTTVAADVKMSNGLTLTDTAMNRYDMALALYNVILNQGKKSAATKDQLTNAQNSIKDWSSIKLMYTNAVKYNYALGIITGMTDGKFHGEQSMTRAQACTVIMRMLKLINNYNPGDKDNDQYDDGQSQNQNKLANGKDITEANVLAILADIQREYPTGTIWGDIGTANNHYYANGGTAGSDMANLVAKFKTASSNGAAKTSTKYACGGWACMVTERIFGKTGYPFREVKNTKDVRAGDVIIIFNNNGLLKHVEIASSNAVADKYGMYGFSCCSGNVTDANGIGHVKWQTGAANTLTSNVRCFTRYPEIESETP